MMRTGHLLAARAAGHEPVTVDIRGNQATNGEYLFPIANGILTTENDDQAEVRMAQTGLDCAIAAIEMARLLPRL